MLFLNRDSLLSGVFHLKAIQTIKTIHANGTSIIWIEHVVHALLAVVGRLIVIDIGKKIAEGDPKEVMASKQVQEIYLGIEADA